MQKGMLSSWYVIVLQDEEKDLTFASQFPFRDDWCLYKSLFPCKNAFTKSVIRSRSNPCHISRTTSVLAFLLLI